MTQTRLAPKRRKGKKPRRRRINLEIGFETQRDRNRVGSKLSYPKSKGEDEGASH